MESIIFQLLNDEEMLAHHFFQMPNKVINLNNAHQCLLTSHRERETERQRKIDIIYDVFIKEKKENLNQIKPSSKASKSNCQFSGNTKEKNYMLNDTTRKR